jgi:very-short-patch-repair endonuclease
MSRIAAVPPDINAAPFRASRAIAAERVSGSMLRGAQWRRLYFDVYIHASAFDPDDHDMWCAGAALILTGGACLGGWSAAHLWGVSVAPANAPVWVNVPLRGRMRSQNRLHLRRTPLGPTDRDRVRTLPVTSGVRTAFDLARCLPEPEALIALDALCHELVKVDELERLATDRWSWPGTCQLRTLLPLIEPATESPMETRVRLLIIRARLPRPEVQVEVRSAEGHFIGRVDLGYRRWKIAIEYEGDHHRERHQYQLDVTRLNDLRDNGWLVLRFTSYDVFRTPDRLVRQVARAILDRR